MPNEELVQRKYLSTGALRGDRFGNFEELNLGSTSVSELESMGLEFTLPSSIAYPFKEYKPPKTPRSAKPDRVFLDRRDGMLRPVAIGEHKKETNYRSDKARLKAAEQALFSAAALGTKIAATTDGKRFHYIDVEASLNKGAIVDFSETRDFNPAVLEDLLLGEAAVMKDPKPLAETVWQIIWHATKEEPKQCLLTFVEIFILKFLSDNLRIEDLPEAYRFYALLEEPEKFKARYGTTAIDYYTSTIRPHIKKLFPDVSHCEDPAVPALFGQQTIVSKTSVINGFAFLTSSQDQPIETFNRIFRDILLRFQKFGSLSAIDPEFKMRLYETFLKNTPRQQKLGQFFTPRNVVRQMIRMARLDSLKDGAVVLDPAAGVGGFILEPLLLDGALKGNVDFKDGHPTRRVKTIGIDVDKSAHILAKANMLIHLSEKVRDPSTTVRALNEAMAETFVLMNDNEMLGALGWPPRNSVDVILTNPPYVTQGSKVYRDEVRREVKTPRNGVDLREYYDGWGLGLESYFMRYISGALKPGGRAFVIVPMGMLNRTEPGPKSRILKECNILASIALPRNTFFNTAQPTHIIVLERRHTDSDSRPKVLCGFARSIGETLDVTRVPTPDDNDLETVANVFVKLMANRKSKLSNPVVKIVSADEFSPEDRWDVARFWTDDELVALGVRDSTVSRDDFIEDALNQIAAISDDMENARTELALLTAGNTTELLLSDLNYFAVRSGTRITSKDVRENPGDVPVYSCFKEANATKGRVSEAWLKANQIDVETEPLVTVMANGAKAVGKVFVRSDDKYVVTDDVIAVEVLSDDLDLEYVATQLRSAIDTGGYVYEAKLFKGRVQQLKIDVPIKDDGTIDLDQQQVIARAIKRFDTIRSRLKEIGAWSASARID